MTVSETLITAAGSGWAMAAEADTLPVFSQVKVNQNGRISKTEEAFTQAQIDIDADGWGGWIRTNTRQSSKPQAGKMGKML